jgi:hypothetical protein
MMLRSAGARETAERFGMSVEAIAEALKPTLFPTFRQLKQLKRAYRKGK